MLLIEGIKDFLRDLINVKLLILKFTYFTLLGAVVILWPQFTVHQESLGLTTYQTGVVATIGTVLGIFLPFFSGFFGDKLGNFKNLMSIITVLTTVPILLLAWIPSAKVDVPTSNGISNVTAANTTAATNTSTNTVLQEVDSEQLVVTFWLYLGVRTAFGVLYGAAYTLFEAAVMANMQDSGINYGYQRVWGTVAAMVTSYIGGKIVEATGSYSVIFYVSAVLQFLTGVLMLGVKMDFKVPKTSLTKGILKYLLNPEIIMFFCAMLATGMMTGYVETFMYRFLFVLGAKPVLLGLTVTVGAPFEIVFTLLTTYFVKLVGHVPLIVLGIFCYAVEAIGLSLLVDPWWVLPLQMLESAGNGLLFTAAIMYCTVIVSIDTIASFRGLHASIFSGFGKLLGNLLGNEIREVLGDRTSFQVWSGIALVCAIIYGIGYTLLKRQKTERFSVKPFESNGVTQEKMDKDLGIDNKAWDSCE